MARSARILESAVTEAAIPPCQRSELQFSPLMKDVADDVLDELIDKGKLLQLKPDDPLLYQDVRGGYGLFILLGGAMGVYRKTAELATQRLAILQPGDCLGEYSLLDGKPMSASARALELTRLLMIPRALFLAVAERDPRSGCALYRNLAAYLVRRLRAD